MPDTLVETSAPDVAPPSTTSLIHARGLTKTFGDLVEDSAGADERHVLIEPRHSNPRRAPDGATVRGHLAADDLEQARLAGAVAANERDTLTGVDL